MTSEFNSRLKSIEKLASIEDENDSLLRKVLAYRDYCESPAGSTQEKDALDAWHKLDPTESVVKYAEAIERRIELAKKVSEENRQIALLAGWAQ